VKPIERALHHVTRQPWGTETLLAETPHYSLKLLLYRSGKAGGLQMHLRKTESFHLAEGMALVGHDEGGVWVETVMEAGQTYTIPAGAPHQFTALTDCTVYEASTPVKNDRVNVADRYGREPEPDALPTTYTLEELAALEALHA
jgi:mannose-6-phosphate isomerase-like protein (cupin superfamily)